MLRRRPRATESQAAAAATALIADPDRIQPTHEGMDAPAKLRAEPQRLSISKTEAGSATMLCKPFDVAGRLLNNRDLSSVAQKSSQPRSAKPDPLVVDF